MYNITLRGTKGSSLTYTEVDNNFNRIIIEDMAVKTGATGTVTHDFSETSVWYHTSPAADFTVNFTNVPTTNNRSTSVALILVQGATAYIPSAVQVGGAAQTILWQGGLEPIGTSDGTDVVSFTLIRSSSTWSVIGSLTGYS
jgi:hypothetical protein